MRITSAVPAVADDGQRDRQMFEQVDHFTEAHAAVMYSRENRPPGLHPK